MPELKSNLLDRCIYNGEVNENNICGIIATITEKMVSWSLLLGYGVDLNGGPTCKLKELGQCEINESLEKIGYIRDDKSSYAIRLSLSEDLKDIAVEIKESYSIHSRLNGLVIHEYNKKDFVPVTETFIDRGRDFFDGSDVAKPESDLQVQYQQLIKLKAPLSDPREAENVRQLFIKDIPHQTYFSEFNDDILVVNRISTSLGEFNFLKCQLQWLNYHYEFHPAKVDTSEPFDVIHAVLGKAFEADNNVSCRERLAIDRGLVGEDKNSAEVFAKHYQVAPERMEELRAKFQAKLDLLHEARKHFCADQSMHSY